MKYKNRLEYDPEAEAAKNKIAGQSGSNEVATNEMKGTYQPTNDTPQYGEPPQYTEPPPEEDYGYEEPANDQMGQSNQGL